MDYTVADFIREGLYSTVRAQLSMLIQAGVPLPTVAKFAGQLQQSIHRALISATQSATLEMTGLPEQPPIFGQTMGDLMDDDDEQSPQQPKQPPQSGPPDDKNPFA